MLMLDRGLLSPELTRQGEFLVEICEFLWTWHGVRVGCYDAKGKILSPPLTLALQIFFNLTKVPFFVQKLTKGSLENTSFTHKMTARCLLSL